MCGFNMFTIEDLIRQDSLAREAGLTFTVVTRSRRSLAVLAPSTTSLVAAKRSSARVHSRQVLSGLKIVCTRYSVGCGASLVTSFVGFFPAKEEIDLSLHTLLVLKSLIIFECSCFCRLPWGLGW